MMIWQVNERDLPVRCLYTSTRHFLCGLGVAFRHLYFSRTYAASFRQRNVICDRLGGRAGESLESRMGRSGALKISFHMRQILAKRRNDLHHLSDLSVLQPARQFLVGREEPGPDSL
ncbi:hypothetical protein E2C01_005122 [Portunus trituberculatus]|uniref:Uncharacterized protein n=1 Tax=Portunus trituberculatus TaxID=210409 RepID=A0A5B7CTF1_PORTR|nr:hypothetical protein [Portunus trituberculatus]